MLLDILLLNGTLYICTSLFGNGRPLAAVRNHQHFILYIKHNNVSTVTSYTRWMKTLLSTETIVFVWKQCETANKHIGWWKKLTHSAALSKRSVRRPRRGWVGERENALISERLENEETSKTAHNYSLTLPQNQIGVTQ